MGHQACSAAPALNRREDACAVRQRFPDHYGDAIVKPHQKPRFLITLSGDYIGWESSASDTGAQPICRGTAPLCPSR